MADFYACCLNYPYDSNGNMQSKSIQLADGTATTWNCTHAFKEVLTATDPLNHTTTNVYDAKGNLLTTTTAPRLCARPEQQ